MNPHDPHFLAALAIARREAALLARKQAARQCARMARNLGAPQVSDAIEAVFGVGAWDNGVIWHAGGERL